MKNRIAGKPVNPPFGLLALADGSGSWGLLLGARAEGESCCCESDNCCDLGDGHGIFRLLSLLVAGEQLSGVISLDKENSPKKMIST